MTDENAAAQAEYEAAAAACLASDNNAPYNQVASLGYLMVSEYQQAQLERRDTEQRMLKDLRQYRGIYDPEVIELIGKNRSKAFVRATRVKVKTVDARVADLLFPSNSERNYSAEATASPSIDEATSKKIVETLTEVLGKPPGQKEYDGAVLEFVKNAAKRMTSVIDDQLAESDYRQIARQVLHSGHLYGTGILKAPLVERKQRTKFMLEGSRWVMKTESYVVPFMEYVPIWHFYPDMSATSLKNCRYVYELHLMTRAALGNLARNKHFNGQAIRDYILAHPKGYREIRDFDQEIRSLGDRNASQAKEDGQYSVIERWGWLDGEVLAQAGVRVPVERLHESFFGNVWFLPNGTILKVVLQPLNGVTWPYHLYYADKDETSIFGEGFPSIMRDDQTMINAGTRMILDNAALTAGPQLEANMKLLVASEKADDMYPFKIWMRNGEEPNSPAIRVLDIPNGLEELFPIVNMFKENADDVTAIPRYMQGENATTGAAGTASGMSMLMANASIVLKDLITNYDIGITRPFIQALYFWNMQFNPDNSIKGDFDIKARGTTSLMAKEIRAQQLNQFASTISPADEPFIKRDELLRQRADAHDLTNIVKTTDEVAASQNDEAAKAQAQLAQQMQDLNLKAAQLNVEKLMAEIERIKSDAERLQATATKTSVDAAYAGMQAGGVATSRPEIAPAGDAILKSAGFIDKTPQEGTPASSTDAAPEGIPDQGANPPQPDSAAPVGATVGAQVGANVGERAGIETPEIDG